MQKIVINACYGGFGLSDAACDMYVMRAGITRDDFHHSDLERDDPILVKIVEELGEAADGRCASLTIVEIPDDVKWEICEYDGSEWVAEQHRKWF